MQKRRKESNGLDWIVQTHSLAWLVHDFVIRTSGVFSVLLPVTVTYRKRAITHQITK